ncbi:[FeFe] hydrogenase H-cluster radical SAM maturase HydG [Kiritimatiella glycovorans]|uniref:2-iminoacetate synthase n=1 Tax=Kiritimatiella glycovorans TaxID=1307763 RepID=A0A0G3EFG8_9BACT|nr:[FeFe] hydrogenase H-cluster radical SAM maturase HydG [Kiritimatiella glycovorans]AKJ65093.1 2-iminoacetate synthase [Kiritimatiella glycovorans]
MSTLKEKIIKPDEITKYMDGDRDFIDDGAIERTLAQHCDPDPTQVRDILAKSRAVETLTPDETAVLLHVEDPELLEEMRQTAREVKLKVYDNRIVTFAPLYMSNLCVNNCAYCGFRTGNPDAVRRKLSMDEVRRETEALAGEIGHKRLIVVYGEHPETGAEYIADTIRTVYDVEVPVRHGKGCIRRVNINAAPMSIDDLRMLHDVGIGTFQVFQETYHHDTYASLHPADTIKGDYRWRLYCMHRAFEAGVDDVGIGTLFGLYDWRFEVMGLLQHARELEDKFNIGPHTISFPRLEPAGGSPLTRHPRHRVSDEDFRRLVTVLRLAVPYTGLIITARESAELRDEVLVHGCTQTDASTRIGIGAYSETDEDQHEERQQFMLGDTRSLEELIVALAEKGIITSFCTAGYRCGRTGECIMDLLRTGQEGRFCKLNAVLTFREWLDDFASEEARTLCEPVVQQEIAEIRERVPQVYEKFMEHYHRTAAGARDLYF